MCELSFVQGPATDASLMSIRRVNARHRRRLAQAARLGAIDLPTVTLETERMIPIRADLASILELRFALLACRAQNPDSLRPTVTFVS